MCLLLMTPQSDGFIYALNMRISNCVSVFLTSKRCLIAGFEMTVG